MIFYGLVHWQYLGAITYQRRVHKVIASTNSAVVWRNIGDLIAMNSMFLALVYVPLSTVGRIRCAYIGDCLRSFVSWERVGLKRASAIFIGFLGTLLIIQPGAATSISQQSWY